MDDEITDNLNYIFMYTKDGQIYCDHNCEDAENFSALCLAVFSGTVSKDSLMCIAQKQFNLGNKEVFENMLKISNLIESQKKENKEKSRPIVTPIQFK